MKTGNLALCPLSKRLLNSTSLKLEIAAPLLEKGDVDMLYNVSEKDISELKATDNFTVVSTPIENCLYAVDLNTQAELAGAANPFSDVKVRQAVAYAMPYDAIVETAL